MMGRGILSRKSFSHGIHRSFSFRFLPALSLSAWSISALVQQTQPRSVQGSTPLAFANRNLSTDTVTAGTGRKVLHRTMTTQQSAVWNDVLPYEQGSHRAAKITIPPSFTPTDIDNDNDPFDKKTFPEKLKSTIESCKQLGLSSLWIQVPMNRGSLLEDMVDTGLQFHHAEGTMANMCLWLESGESKVPTYATHQIGVGAMVVNSRDEILSVREIRNNYMPWKIPGGLSELGEQLDAAAVREVMEETGVPCRFKSIVCFRHSHGLQFGRSDLYFVCRLEPIEQVREDGTVIIPTPVPQAGEIAEAAWIPIREYREMVCAENGGHPMMKHVIRIYDQGQEIQKTIVNSIVPGRKANPIYHPPLMSIDNLEKDES